MRRMPDKNAINNIESDIIKLQEDVKYLKEHLAQYYNHSINVSGNNDTNIVYLQLNIVNNDSTKYTKIHELAVRYTAQHRFACSGYIKLTNGMSYPVIAIAFAYAGPQDLCDVYYYDSQSQSVTYFRFTDNEKNMLSDNVKEV